MHLSRPHFLSLPLLLAVLSCGHETNKSSERTQANSADQIATPNEDASKPASKKSSTVKPSAAKNTGEGVKTASTSPPPAPVENKDKPEEVPPEKWPNLPASKLNWDGQNFQGDASFALIPTE